MPKHTVRKRALNRAMASRNATRARTTTTVRKKVTTKRTRK